MDSKIGAGMSKFTKAVAPAHRIRRKPRIGGPQHHAVKPWSKIAEAEKEYEHPNHQCSEPSAASASKVKKNLLGDDGGMKGIIEQAVAFYSQHPQLVQGLGAGALTFLMSRISQHR